MDLTLSLPDLLLCAASTILVLTIILLLKKMNAKNYVFISMLSMYFLMLIAQSIFFITMHLNLLTTKTIFIPIVGAFILIFYNVFHYLTLRQLILKTNLLKIKDLIHLLPIIIVIVIICFFFDPVYLSKQKSLNTIFETQYLMYSYKRNYIIGLIRLLHPLFYLVLGGQLVYSFYKTVSDSPGTKSRKKFVYFFYFQKTIFMIWFLIGLFGFDTDIMTFSYISILGFSISALIMSTYVILNPDIFIQITKPNFETKKIILDNSKLPDLYNQINVAINGDQLFLNPQYNLTNLSSDTGISANTIREIITVNDFKNYSAFINSFRIDYAKNLIRNGYLDTFSIESLAKDSGFQAEVTFYRVFKKIHNCTPKEYSYTIKSNSVALV